MVRWNASRFYRMRKRTANEIVNREINKERVWMGKTSFSAMARAKEVRVFFVREPRTVSCSCAVQCTVIVSPVVSIFEWYLRGSQEEIAVILCHIELNAAYARTTIPRGVVPIAIFLSIVTARVCRTLPIIRTRDSPPNPQTENWRKFEWWIIRCDTPEVIIGSLYVLDDVARCLYGNTPTYRSTLHADYNF